MKSKISLDVWPLGFICFPLLHASVSLFCLGLQLCWQSFNLFAASFPRSATHRKFSQLAKHVCRHQQLFVKCMPYWHRVQSPKKT